VFLLILCLSVMAAGQQTEPRAVRQGAPDVPSAKKGSQEARPVRKPRPDYVPRNRVTDFNAVPVTVAQLVGLLGEARGRHDKEVESALLQRVLTERMRGAELTAWRAQMPGKRSREALTALADASSFLNVPRTEIPAAEPPNPAQARQILERAVEYLNTSIPKLPVFTATQVTTRYVDTLKNAEEKGAGGWGGYPWRVYGRSKREIELRGSKERVMGEPGSGKVEATGLLINSSAESVLLMVIRGALRGSIFWSHWEQGMVGREAVLRYEVPKTVSRYGVTFSRLDGKHERKVLQEVTSYHGEIAIDPVSGEILRITVMADLNRDLPLTRSDMVVEYGRVNLGGSTYLLPVRSVAISSGRSVAGDESGEEIPDVTILNDTGYENYRLEGGQRRK